MFTKYRLAPSEWDSLTVSRRDAYFSMVQHDMEKESEEIDKMRSR